MFPNPRLFRRDPASSRSRRSRGIRRLCRLAVLAALYVLLTMVSVRVGNLRLTFASLPVVAAALLLGPWEAAAVALTGEFLNQMLAYGFTATTALWLLPPAIRGLTVGAFSVRCLRSGRLPEERPAALYAVCMAAAVLTTVCNTAVLGVDARIFGYYTPALLTGDLAVRLLTGAVTAVLVTTVALPLVRLLRRELAAGRA